MQVKEYKIGNATVCITRPELSDKEREKRERIILNALHQYGKAAHEKAVQNA